MIGCLFDAGSDAASFKSGFERAFDAPDADFMKVEAVTHLCFQGLDKKVIECNLFKQILGLLGAWLFHRYGLLWPNLLMTM